MLTPGFEPLGFLQALALWAMSIATGIIGDADTIAGVAAVHVTAQSGRAALGDMPHHRPLSSGR